MARVHHWLQRSVLLVLEASLLSCAHTPAPHVAGGLPAVPDPTSGEPVTAAMAVRPERASAGETVELIVYVRIAKAHYLHAPVDSDDHFLAVAMEDMLPEGVEAAGAWKLPPPEVGTGTSLVYRDSLIVRRQLRVSPRVAPQTLLLSGGFHYQACTDDLCWPPGMVEVSVPLVIQAKGR